MTFFPNNLAGRSGLVICIGMYLIIIRYKFEILFLYLTKKNFQSRYSSFIKQFLLFERFFKLFD